MYLSVATQEKIFDNILITQLVHNNSIRVTKILDLQPEAPPLRGVDPRRVIGYFYDFRGSGRVVVHEYSGQDVVTCFFHV